MITVRFPSGFSVQYNSAHYVSQDPTYAFRRIYPSKHDYEKNQGIIAWVPPEAIVEFAQPCRTYFAEDGERIASLEREIKSLKRKLAKVAK